MLGKCLENPMVIGSESFFAGEVFATCECCGNPIYKATDTLNGDEYVELVPDEYIHVDCISAWVKENKKEAK